MWRQVCQGVWFTLFEIFIFCPKIQLWFPEKIVDFFGWKTRENVVVLDFLAVDNFDFTRKIVKKKNWVKNSWKYWGFVKIEFLDKNSTFRIVCGFSLPFTKVWKPSKKVSFQHNIEPICCNSRHWKFEGDIFPDFSTLCITVVYVSTWICSSVLTIVLPSFIVTNH